MSIYGNPVMLGGSGGGGGTNVLSGTTAPTAAQGSNRAMYLQYADFSSLTTSITHVKLSIFATRGGSSGTQLSLVELLDSNGTVVSWPSGTTVTSNAAAYAPTETPDKLLSSVDTKYYTSTNPSANSPIEIVFALGSSVQFNKWRWYTANDTTDRDPKSFAFSVSIDGVNYVECDNQTITPTSSRKALAYTSDPIILQGKPITAAYAKVDGVWQDLIGTDITDIDLGS